MRHTAPLILLLGTLCLGACAPDRSPVAPDEPGVLEPETVTAAAAPAGLGPCRPMALRESQNQRITPGSCLFDEATGRRSVYFRGDTPSQGRMLTLTVTPEFNGVFGIKEDTQDPKVGIVWGSLSFAAGKPRSLAFVGSSPSQQVFVSGFDGTQTGPFRLDAVEEPVTFRCGVPMALEAPVAIGETIEESRACRWTVRFSPFPEAIGAPLLGHFYNARLQAGRSYEIRVEGLTQAFNAGLTVFSGGQMAAQSVGPLPVGGVRTLVITPPSLRYYGIEISTGGPDGQGGFITPPTGSYTLSVTEL